MKIILYIASSIDGYIAREDGSIDWLKPYEGVEAGYEEFLKGISTVIMGNTTYKQVLTFGEFPYKGKDTIVFTRDRSKTKDENVRYFSGDPRDLLANLSPYEGDIWLVGGSSIIDEFRKRDLIDEYIITWIPILLGRGIPLFREGSSERKLDLVESKRFDKGMIQIDYRRLKEGENWTEI